MRFRIVCFALLAGCAAQPPQPASDATPEQKARAEVASAFMTGTAPGVVNEKVVLGPTLQARLGLPPGTQGAKVYDALIGLAQGATPSVRDATPADAKRFPDLPPPLFTVSAGDLNLLLRYDLQSRNVTFAEQLSAPPIAAATPVADAAAAAPAAPAYSVVEPKTPAKAKAKRKARAKAKPKAKTRVAQAPAAPVAEPPLKRSGPCVIKPVMSDQDLVNCGATPPRY